MLRDRLNEQAETTAQAIDKIALELVAEANPRYITRAQCADVAREFVIANSTHISEILRCNTHPLVIEALLFRVTHRIADLPRYTSAL